MRPSADEIRALPLFAGLEPEAVEWIAGRVETREADAGMRLTSEAASGYLFFVIFDETVSVFQDDEMIATLGPGEFFGEGALLGSSGRRNATVVASTPVRVGVMFGTDFRLLEQKLPDVAAHIRETLAARDAAVS